MIDGEPGGARGMYTAKSSRAVPRLTQFYILYCFRKRRSEILKLKSNRPLENYHP